RKAHLAGPARIGLYINNNTRGLSMALPHILDKLSLPVVGAPLFIISHPALVIAQCKTGIVGAFPALNARPVSQLDEWLHDITETLAAHDRAHPDRPAAPFAVNQIVHKSNARLEEDLALTGAIQSDAIMLRIFVIGRGGFDLRASCFGRACSNRRPSRR